MIGVPRKAQKLRYITYLSREMVIDFSLQFTLGPASEKPMHISLLEITAEEAAEHATKVFLDVSILNMGSRYCIKRRLIL